MDKDSAVYGLRCFMSQPITALVIMGVAGCGKSSVSQALCQLNGATPIEGDAFHPAANIEKMSAGIPLTDEDRAGWLDGTPPLVRAAPVGLSASELGELAKVLRDLHRPANVR